MGSKLTFLVTQNLVALPDSLGGVFETLIYKSDNQGRQFFIGRNTYIGPRTRIGNNAWIGMNNTLFGSVIAEKQKISPQKNSFPTATQEASAEESE